MSKRKQCDEEMDLDEEEEVEGDSRDEDYLDKTDEDDDDDEEIEDSHQRHKQTTVIGTNDKGKRRKRVYKRKKILLNTDGEEVPHFYEKVTTEDGKVGLLCKYGCGHVILSKNPEHHSKKTCLKNPSSILYRKQQGVVIPTSSSMEYPVSVYNSSYDKVEPPSFQIPELRPTMEELKAMTVEEYVAEIVEKKYRYHEQFGLVKVIPPKEFVDQASVKDLPLTGNITPLLQNFRMVGTKTDVFIVENTDDICIPASDYRATANEFLRYPPIQLDKTDAFWDCRRLRSSSPLYATDVTQAATLFDRNWKIWNLSTLESTLSLCNKLFQNKAVKGITSIYTYVASWGTGFSLHLENMDTYSINHLHDEEPDGGKQWYTVRPYQMQETKLALNKEYVNEYKQCGTAFRHKILFPAPSMLTRNNVEHGCTIQKKGEYIIAFPGVCHWGFNRGYNIAEAVNFATPRWIDIAKQADLCDRECLYKDFTFNMDNFQQGYIKKMNSKTHKRSISDEEYMQAHPEFSSCQLFLHHGFGCAFHFFKPITTIDFQSE